MKVVFMGTPDFSVGALEAIWKAGHEITAVVTQPDKPKGRGGKLQMSPVKEFAVSRGLPVFQPVRIKRPEAVEQLKTYEADIFVVAAFGQILSQEILDMPRFGCVNIHAYLRAKAEKQKPGEHGLLALDWWNGHRSILVDVDLTGMLLGMTLQTKPEDIYRALIEATAYGTRVLVENYRAHGLPVEEFYASGGIAFKDPMAMQIYADVLNMPIKIAGTLQGPALGSAIFGAVAAGGKAGGYDSVFDAARSMGKVKDEVYQPSAENAAVYGQLYQEYKRLHDYFGCGENDVMKRLKALKLRQSGQGR